MSFFQFTLSMVSDTFNLLQRHRATCSRALVGDTTSRYMIIIANVSVEISHFDIRSENQCGTSVLHIMPD